MRFILILCLVTLGFSNPTLASDDSGASSAGGKVVSHVINSKALKKNMIGISHSRNIQVYLPPGYVAADSKDYRVIYYIPQDKIDLKESGIAKLLDEGIKNGVISPLIFVAGDFTIEKGFNFWGNNQVVGYWLDHVKDEIVGFVDSQYRTKKTKEGRGIAGHFLGGYAAMKLAMENPDVFSSLYTFHIVGTSTGEYPSRFRPDWSQIANATDTSKLTGFAFPFVAMAQAHSPNSEKPPFHADFMVEEVNGKVEVMSKNIRKIYENFLIDSSLPEYIDNLKSLKGIKLVWGRWDSNADHVYANRKLVMLLTDYGVDHEAIEHNGNGWDYKMTKKGRFYKDMLPFFEESLSL